MCDDAGASVKSSGRKPIARVGVLSPGRIIKAERDAHARTHARSSSSAGAGAQAGAPPWPGTVRAAKIIAMRDDRRGSSSGSGTVPHRNLGPPHAAGGVQRGEEGEEEARVHAPMQLEGAKMHARMVHHWQAAGGTGNWRRGRCRVRARVGGESERDGASRCCIASARPMLRWGCPARGHGAVATQTRGCSQCLYQRS